jgi:small subunit ribosomal protein S23
MGRYDFRPLRVHQTATQLLATERIASTPPWYNVIGQIPPSETLVRTQPLQHQETPKTRRPKTKKPSKLFHPMKVVYEEDNLRKQFFSDHPWELARPRTVLENDGKDAERCDWSSMAQLSTPLSGER